ncbi:hypothetical protein DFS33DRAFT_1340854 [Desarmillaria ectypa]|nr:hypothetical protein DFS33DRAFT_1340854 [Desarmillaria ectypa]
MSRTRPSAIYMSNHGGRIFDEVFELMEAYADGGVRRGNHVVTLSALGMRAVGFGRSPIFANVWGDQLELFGDALLLPLAKILRHESQRLQTTCME